MKRVLLALCLLALPGLAAAQEAEHRLTTAELRGMAESGALLCERWDAPNERCDAVYRWNRVQGEMTETRLETLSNVPPIDSAFQYPVAFQDDQACVTLDANATTILLLANGRELTSEETAPVRASVDSAYAPVNGQVVCTAYFRDATTSMLRAEASVGGQRRTQLDTSFRVLDAPPLPRMRPVRQPWTAAVLRTVAALPPEPGQAPQAAASETPAATEAPAPTVVAAVPALASTPPAAPAASAPGACQPSRMARLRSWLHIGGSTCPSETAVQR